MSRTASAFLLFALLATTGNAAAQSGAAPLPPGVTSETPAAAPNPESSSETADPAPPAADAPAVDRPAAAPVPARAPSSEESSAVAPATPPAPDQRARHFTASALLLLTAPFGSLERQLPWYDVAGTGPGLGLELAAGIGRSVSLGLWATAHRLPAGNDCRGCSTTLLAAGPLVRFHLVQGMRFDPHLAYGFGLRSFTTSGADRDLDYLGLDWIRLVAGGDWYASPHLAFSPFFELGAGATVVAPDLPPVIIGPGEDRVSGVYASATLGLRLTLDVPGR